MLNFVLIFFLLSTTIIQSCGIKTSKQIGLRFATIKSKLPDTLHWKNIGFAKELVNQKEMTVFISGGSKTIPLDKWEDFKPSFPYKKNIDRYLLFKKTAFYRSPNTDVDCKESDCTKQREYKNYTWVEIARLVCVDFVGGKTDMLKPERGHLSIKTIQKCQTVMFTDSIFQLTDNKGNFFVMHATETGTPDTSVVLPNGWTLKKININKPLIISPFGGGNECYYNIVGDNLGQGYHQYIFADKYYPSEE